MDTKQEAASIPFTAIVLAAGKGTRMKSSLPKVLHQVARKPMLHHVVDNARMAGAKEIVVVTAPDQEVVRMHGKHEIHAVQEEQLGTGHAVNCTKDSLPRNDGPALILYGDTPLITARTMHSMIESLMANDALSLVVLGMETDNPTGYGRLIMDGDALTGIVEEKDATEAQRAITLCNSGVVAARLPLLFDILDELSNDNASGEYYLTDAVGIANSKGFKCGMVLGNAQELQGVNSRAQLAQAEAIMQQRLREHHMANGVTLVAPETVFFAADTVIGKDTIIEPHVVFGPEVTMGERVDIRSYSHIEGAVIANYSMVGPFARIRPGSTIDESVKIGNFVEIKKSMIEKGAKISHLSYIGDAHVGEDANIGAGTITCNYDGYNKFHTEIGAHSFIGSNTALVAPVTVGEGAIIGAGSVITEDVEADALGVARGRQESKTDWAKVFREKQQN